MARKKRKNRVRRKTRRSAARKSTATATPVRRRRRRVVRRRRRSANRMAVARRSPVRGIRRRRRGSRGSRGSKFDLKQLGMIGAGAIASGFVTNFALKQAAKLGFQVPFANHPIGAVAIRAGVPFLAYKVIEKFQPKFANHPLVQGIVLGGIISGMQAGLELATGGSVAGTKDYVDPVDEYLSNTPVNALNGMPGEMALNEFAASPYESASAFNNDPWTAN